MEQEDQEEKAREHRGNFVDLVGAGPAPLWGRGVLIAGPST